MIAGKTRFFALFAALMLAGSPALAQEEDAPEVEDVPEVEPTEEQPAPLEEPDQDEPDDADDEEPVAAEGTEDVQEVTTATLADVTADPRPTFRISGDDHEDTWTLDIGGYIRGGYTYIQPDPNNELFGRNDGFSIRDARLILRAESELGLGMVMSLDAGSRLLRTTPDSPVQELSMRMADTYAFYAPFEFLELNLGQFKAPFDVEDLISTAELLFIDRAVANRGVQDVEGYNVAGLSQGRQVGVRAHGKYDILGDSEGPSVGYALAVANGNGPNQSMNNNDRLAYYGRAYLGWGNLVSVGGAAFYNDNTFGDPPNRVDRTTFGWTADLRAYFMGASLLANVVSETRDVPEIEQDPETTGLGYQVQIAYQEPYFGFQPAYRFAYYDPTYSHGGEGGSDFFDDDALTYHTIGLNYNALTYPVRLMVNYTLAMQESEARSLDNDRLDILLQLQW